MSAIVRIARRGVASVRARTGAAVLVSRGLHRCVLKRTTSVSVAGSVNRIIGAQAAHRRWYSSDLPEHVVVTMPALSPTMEVGSLVSWSVGPGDEIAAGDAMGEIETDKATMSFDSTEDGFVAKLLVEAGTSDIPLGTPMMVVCENEDDIAAFTDFVPAATSAAAAPSASADAPTPTTPPPPPPPPPASTPSPSPAVSAAPPSGDRIIASPLAKNMAAELELPLGDMVGTGQAGRITKADVLAFKKLFEEKAAAQPVEEVAATVSSGAASAGGDYIDEDLSNVRKVIARRLTESKQNVPHYYLSTDVKMDNVLAIRKQLNEMSDGAYKLSVNDFIVKASALSMKHVPEVNSAWMDTFIRQYNNVDISIAVSTDNGLITPIVTNAHTRGLASISDKVRDLATRAREKKLAPEEFQGGTFSISNLGMFGVKSFSAIINPPQACILAVGTTEKIVVPDESSESGLGVAEVMSVSLSCDHRVVDGAVGAQWLKHFKAYLENPMTMLL
eukprot:m.345116 g.345116  ORF g.345116 m.345116 type:complete len:503 (-) comp20655_c0_seq1:1349-2857(-)